MDMMSMTRLMMVLLGLTTCTSLRAKSAASLVRPVAAE
jgi:hypothetical protein